MPKIGNRVIFAPSPLPEFAGASGSHHDRAELLDDRSCFCRAVFARKTDNGFIGGISLLAGNVDVTVYEPPQTELHADAYQSFGSYLGDLLLDCLGPRMRSICTLLGLTSQFIGD